MIYIYVYCDLLSDLFSCCTLVLWFSVPFLFYPRLSSPRQFLILSLPFLSHLFASSLMTFLLNSSPLSSPRLLFPFFYMYRISSLILACFAPPCTVVSLLSSSPPCILSYHASLLCFFLRFPFVFSSP